MSFIQRVFQDGLFGRQLEKLSYIRYLSHLENITRHCKKPFEIAMFLTQQTCSVHCKPSTNQKPRK